MLNQGHTFLNHILGIREDVFINEPRGLGVEPNGLLLDDAVLKSIAHNDALQVDFVVLLVKVDLLG